MTRLYSFERGAYRAAFVLFLAVTARFGWVVAHRTWVHRAEPPSAVPKQSSKDLPTIAELRRQLSMPMLNPSAIDSAIAEAVGSAGSHQTAPPTAEYVKSYLSVQVGPPRSELRVDGVLLGRTPYVGQISCQRGRTVKIDLLPPTGMPKEYQIPCLSGEMSLRDDP